MFSIKHLLFPRQSSFPSFFIKLSISITCNSHNSCICLALYFRSDFILNLHNFFEEVRKSKENQGFPDFQIHNFLCKRPFFSISLLHNFSQNKKIRKRSPKTTTQLLHNPYTISNIYLQYSIPTCDI